MYFIWILDNQFGLKTQKSLGLWVWVCICNSELFHAHSEVYGSHIAYAYTLVQFKEL